MTSYTPAAMSMKRKASISGLAPSMATPTPSGWAPSNTSTELPSRTRKRFRNGRPDDDVVYEKTLRWIYSAQQQQQQQQTSITPMDTTDDTMIEAESQIPGAEAADPRQQTLLRFFQPQPEPMSPFRPSREALAARANETAIHREDLIRRQTFAQLNTTESTSGSETASPGFFNTETDVDMEMEIDGGESSDNSNPVSKWAFWNGGV